MQHSHEKVAWLQGRELNQYCSGRLSIVNRKLVYITDKGTDRRKNAIGHSFEVDAKNVKGISLNENDTRGTFQLKLADNNLFMATRNRNRDEARVLVDLVRSELISK